MTSNLSAPPRRGGLTERGVSGTAQVLRSRSKELDLSPLSKELGMPTGRMTEPGEIARAVLLLPSSTMPSVIGSTWPSTRVPPRWRDR